MALKKALRSTVETIIGTISVQIAGNRSIAPKDACEMLEEIESYCESARQAMEQENKDG